MADLTQQARELLPCPFCGEAAKHTVWGDAGFNKVECTYCDVGMDYFYHQDDAFEAWNRRAALRAAPEGWSFQQQEDGSIVVTAEHYGAVHVRPDDSDSIAAAVLHRLASDLLAARPQGVR